MKEENDSLHEDEEDVVVVEERDKHTYLYIGLAAALGLALGGLAGSVLTQSKWESAYQKLEAHIEEIEHDKTQVIVKVEEKAAGIDAEIDSRMQKQIDELQLQHQEALNQSKQMVTELEKVNMELEGQVSDLQAKLKEKEKALAGQEKQSEMQSIVIERSRELFQKELKIKQELESLQAQREKIIPKLERYKKECDLYLEGKSWDATSKSCDNQDAMNSELSRIDQLIEVYKLDLREIQQLADSVGI